MLSRCLITSSLSFLFLLLESHPLKILSSWTCACASLFRSRHPSPSPVQPPRLSSLKEKMSPAPEPGNAEESQGGAPSLLDLPELALEYILEKLPPEGLLSMSGVCTALRDRCRSDYFWDKHMKRKWDRVIGPSAYKVWQLCLSPRRDNGDSNQGKQKGLLRLFSLVWPCSWAGERINIGQDQTCSLPYDSSVMSWYIALETGRFWFPAQVYNRENGHAGFLLSCYDAELSYDFRTDTFRARYPPHGRRAMALETGVTWERLRSPQVDTSPHDLHLSDCLKDLCPGDHVEIQWRRNKEFPYGWWYGVVGHLESCNRNESYCRCSSSGAVVLEFNQYSAGSPWSRTTIDRRNHREEGNEVDGFYGGIRKLRTDDEISAWKRLWPTELLE